MIFLSKSFIHFDYGDRNKDIYGQDTPLEYKIENIKNMKISLLIGHIDKLATIESVRQIQKSLEVRNDVYFHDYDELGHHCFFFSDKFEWFKDVVKANIE